MILTLTINPAVDESSSVDYVVSGSKLRCSAPRYEPEGGGLNVARAIVRLGGQATALYAAGGPSGRLLGDLLDAERVPRLEERVAAPAVPVASVVGAGDALLAGSSCRSPARARFANRCSSV